MLNSLLKDLAPPKDLGTLLSQQRWIEFSSEEEAENAIKTLNGSKLDEREITVKPFMGTGEKGYRKRRSRSRSPGRRRKLFVGNLPFEMTWQELKDVFKKYARVERAEIVTRRDVRRYNDRRGVVKDLVMFYLKLQKKHQ